jgi:hypothetical protein
MKITILIWNIAIVSFLLLTIPTKVNAYSSEAKIIFSEVDWTQVYNEHGFKKQQFVDLTENIQTNLAIRGISAVEIPVLLPSNEMICNLVESKNSNLISKAQMCPKTEIFGFINGTNSYTATWIDNLVFFQLFATNKGVASHTANIANIPKSTPDSPPIIVETEYGINASFNKYGVSYLLSSECNSNIQCDKTDLNQKIKKQLEKLIVVGGSDNTTKYSNFSHKTFRPNITPDYFTFDPPGKLKSGSGKGVADNTDWVPWMQFPIEEAPAYANSQVYNPGGQHGGTGGQCAPENRNYPWQDNFCETRTRKNPACDGGTGHQGQDIRAASCGNPNSGTWKPTEWAVAAEKGYLTLTQKSLTINVPDSNRQYRYLHLDRESILNSVMKAENNPYGCMDVFGNWKCLLAVPKGVRLGYVSNEFEDPTTIHLHFEILAKRAETGRIEWLPPYATLVNSYKKLLNNSSYPKVTKINEEIEITVYLESGVDTKINYYNDSLEEYISESSIFTNLEFNRIYTNPSQLKQCIIDKKNLLKRFLRNNPEYDSNSIIKVLSGLVSIKKSAGKKGLSKSKKKLEEYINYRSQYIAEYNRSIVLCYGVDNEGNDSSQYPIQINPMVISNQIQKNISWSIPSSQEQKSIIDILQYVAKNFSFSNEEGQTQYRSLFSNFASPDDWIQFSKSDRDMINIFNDIQKPGNLSSVANTVAHELGHWFGLEHHNLLELFLNPTQRSLYEEGSENSLNKLCQSLVKISESGSRVEVRDRDWFSSGISDTPTTIGLHNTISQNKPATERDFDCYLAQKNRIMELAQKNNINYDISRFFSPNILTMSYHRPSFEIASDEQLINIKKRICEIKGKQNVKTFSCQ